MFSVAMCILRMRAGGSGAYCAHTNSSQACFWDSCDVSAGKRCMCRLDRTGYGFLVLVAIFLKIFFY